MNDFWNAHVEFLTKAFWEKLGNEGDQIAASFACVALASIMPGSQREKAWIARGNYAITLYHQLLKGAMRPKKIPKTKGVLWEAMILALARTPDADSARPFALELSRIWQVFDEELAALNDVWRTQAWVEPWRLELVLKEAANDTGRETSGTYPFVHMAAHRYVGSPEFLKLFKKSF